MVYAEVVVKYWNKQKHLRESKWYKVTLPEDKVKSALFPDFKGWVQRNQFLTIKHEIQLIDSPGKFYMSIMDKNIYFESEKDAVYFSLKYL